MRRIIKNIRFEEGYLDVIVHHRDGTESPELPLVLYKGRYITPYEIKIKKTVTWTNDGIFSYLFTSLYFGIDLNSLVYASNPFLSLLPKEDLRGTYYPIYSVSVKPST